MRAALTAVLFLFLTFFSAAQPAPDNTEYNLGVECPTAQTLSADGTTLWILMTNCFSTATQMLAYNLTDGSQVEVEVPANFLDLLAPLSGQLVLNRRDMMTFLDEEETVLSLRYTDNDTYQPLNLIISLTEGVVLEPDPSDEQVSEFLLSVAEYPESAVYSHVQDLAAVADVEALSVIDLTNGELIFSLPLDYEYNAYPTFSQDGMKLYVAEFNDPEDYDSYASTLSIYSLPDGELINSYDVPSAFVWISPNERYAVSEIGSSDSTSSDLYITDLTTGETGSAIALYEPSRPLIACTNTGRSMTDVDFTIDGRLGLVDVTWFPDSSGFAYSRSYGGDAVGVGNPCTLDTSRLNVIRLGE